MNWKEDLVQFLRVLIGDLDSETYSNTRLRQILVVAAYQLVQSVQFNVTYTIDIKAASISPDPISDLDFSTLTAYKAACIILSNEAKSSANNSVIITDGPSTVNTSSAPAHLIKLSGDMCKQFDNLLSDFLLFPRSRPPRSRPR